MISLTESCRKLFDIIDKFKSHSPSLAAGDFNEKVNNSRKPGQLSNSSSTSSAMSSLSTGGGAVGEGLATNNEIQARNQLASSIICYCYDIAFTVKKVVCIIGADS